MNKTELKRCPFCGGKPDLGSYSSSGNWIVVCSMCEAETQVYETEQEAAKAWNARQVEDELDKKNGCLIGTCHDLHDLVEDFRAECDQKDLEIKRLREALKFYAELDGNGIRLYGEMYDKALEFIDGASFPFGQTARDALKGGEE